MNVRPEELSEKLAERVLYQGELRLSSQLQIALASDQRAVTSAAILVAIGTAAVAFSGDRLFGQVPDLPLALGALATGLTLIFASSFCVAAALPAKFDLVGARPGNWWSDNVESRPYAECVRRESDNYDSRIKRNSMTLNRNAHWLRSGMYTACASPLIGLVVWLVVRLALC